MNSSNTLLPDWCRQSEWFEQEGQSLFRTRNRWDWFYRKHRRDLVDAGAIGRIGNNVMIHRERLRDALDELIVGEAAGRIMHGGCFKPIEPGRRSTGRLDSEVEAGIAAKRDGGQAP